MTAIVVPVKAPGFHVNDDAPEPVKVAEVPVQIVLDELEAEIVKDGLTFKLIV